MKSIENLLDLSLVTVIVLALIGIAVPTGVAYAYSWAAEFNSLSGSGPAGYTSPFTSPDGGAGGNFAVTYNQGLPSNWLTCDGSKIIFNVGGTSCRGRFAATHSIVGTNGCSVGYRMNVKSSTVTRGPIQVCVYNNASSMTNYNCYLKYDGSKITVLNNSGTAYTDPAPFSKSMSGMHNWCLAVKVGADGLAHWRLWIDGDFISFSGSNGAHSYGGVSYSFKTPENSFTAINGLAYIGLGDLHSESGWSFEFDWVRWQNNNDDYWGDPYVTTHPANQTMCSGLPVTFSAAGTSTGTIGYQWQVNSGGGWSNITGATSANYTFTPAIGDNGKQYRCILSNTSTSGTGDAVATNPATLTVGLIPAVPSNPGGTPTASSITWTWQDNSSDETGFKVFADPGAGPPTTLRTTTAADVTSWEYSGLAANSQYAFQVAAVAGGCESAKTANLAKYTLALPPVFGASGDGRIDCDKGSGSSSQWYAGGTAITFSAVNGFGTGQAKASKYEYVWDTSATAPGNWSGASEWASGNLVKSETSSGSYYLHLRACNADGVANTASLTVGPYIVDADAPGTPVVTDDGDTTFNNTELHATWSATAGVSGIVEYQYAISSAQNEANIITGGGWVSTGIDTEATRTDLSLEYGETYYILVKAKSGTGVWSAVGYSDGIMVSEEGLIKPVGMNNAWIGGGDWNYDPDTNAGQKGIAGGVGLNTTALLIKTWGRVTYSDSDYFYIDDGYKAEDGSGHIGIRVDATGLIIPNVNDYVNVTGISSLITIIGELQPEIRVRKQSDILVIE